MTTSTTVTKTSGLTVINLKDTKEGNIERKMTDVSPQAQLNNTLLEALCPGIRVASVTVTPEPLDQVERARVESALSRFNVDGIDYRLIGASGSAKSGKYYAVDARFERPLAARFSDWPQAAVTYFGILVSPCQVRMQVPQGRVTVVPDHELGTNDCRGWIRKSLFDKLALPDGRREIVLRVPKYDFGWQTDYWLAEPITLPKGSKLHVSAHFDNSPANRANPDPKATVRWGDQTWEEMMIGFFTYTVEGSASTTSASR